MFRVEVVAGRYTTPLLLPCVALLPVLLLVVAGTHRVGGAFSEGPELLPFYENLAKWPLLPLYAHILSVSVGKLVHTRTRFQPKVLRGVGLHV